MRVFWEYLSLLRIPILFWGVGVLLAWHPKGLRSALRGAFDARAVAVPTVMIGALVYSFTLGLCAITILEGAPARVGVPPLDGWFSQSVTMSVLAWHDIPAKKGWLLVATIASLPALLGCLRLIFANRERRLMRTLVCLGTLLGLALISFASPPNYWGVAATERIMAPLFRLDPAGYIDAATGHVGRSHIYTVHSILIVFLQLALYLGVILTLIQRRKRRPAPLPQWILRWDNFPVLYSVYAMLGLLCLLLSGLSFFLDGYGISLVAVLVFWRLLVWYFDEGATVGYYRPAQELPTPREVLAANSSETDGRVIAVCASGGGIHASAWTAKVLTELEKQHRHHFAPLVRVISCVSGGSVGAMNFAGSFTPATGQIPDVMLDYPNTQSRISSLPAALGGWFLFDLPRLFIPWLPSWLNRGWSLERRWDIDGFFNWPLAVWGQQAWLGRRPALLFNCTAVETGKPVVFGTSKLAPRIDTTTPPRRDEGYNPSFQSLTGHAVDIMVPTAARMSATFPFVTPASRLHHSAKVWPDWSYVDGGYYDNFGVTTALEFLDHAFSETEDQECKIPDSGKKLLARLSPPVPIRKVLMIEIRAAATPPAEAKSDERERKNVRVRFEQLRAPFRTIFAVRSAAQRLRNDAEIQLAREAFSRRDVTLENVIFEYPEADIPLSWHLTKEDCAQIDQAWEGDSLATQKQAVADFCREPVRLPLPALDLDPALPQSAE